MVLLALLPIIWLIVALGFSKLPGYKACPVAVIISAVVAVAAFGMPSTDAATAFLEGVALAVWPILLVIVAAIFAYNLTVYTKSMDVIKQMLTTVSKDSRILALLIAWGFGAFMEGMAGFGTAVAIPASIMVGLGYKSATIHSGLPYCQYGTYDLRFHRDSYYDLGQLDGFESCRISYGYYIAARNT